MYCIVIFISTTNLRKEKLTFFRLIDERISA